MGRRVLSTNSKYLGLLKKLYLRLNLKLSKGVIPFTLISNVILAQTTFKIRFKRFKTAFIFNKSMHHKEFVVNKLRYDNYNSFLGGKNEFINFIKIRELIQIFYLFTVHLWFAPVFANLDWNSL